MKTKSIKTQAEIDRAIGNAKPIELTTRDGNPRTLRIGNLLLTFSYGAEISEIVAFEEAERFKVEWQSELFGDGESYFDYEHEAAAYARKVRDEAPGLADSIKVQKVKVLVDDDGMVASEVEVLKDKTEEVFLF